MTVKVTKPAVNLREELASLNKPSGIVGESILRADTAADAVEQLNLEDHTFTTFTSTGIDDNATSTTLTLDSSGRVGIGEAAPLSLLVVGANGISTLKATVQVTDTNNGASLALRGQSPVLAFDTTGAGIPKILMDNKGLEFKDGHLDSEGSVAVKIDSSGNLLVATTDDVVWDNAAGSAADNGHNLRDDGRAGFSSYQVTAGSNATVNINRTGTDGDFIRLFKSGALVGAFGVASSDNLYIGSSATDHTGLVFPDNAILPAKELAATDAFVDLGSTTRRFKDLYLSGGVYLGGTVAANKLDDYEEGTWDITITDLTNNATLNASYDTGVYTKVGRLVTLTGRFIMTSKGSLSGRIYISGIPFNGIGGNSYNSGGFSAGKADGLAITAGTSIGGEISSNSSVISLVLWDSADGSSYMDTTNLDATADMSFSMTYMTAA